MDDLSQLFVDALIATDRHSDIPEEQDIYGWLVGAWDSVISDFFDAPPGQARVSRGEWIFARVLEGRAIQDIFIVPSRQRRDNDDWGNANVRYGISYRQYDPALQAWHVDFFNPATGAHNQLIARREGNAIRQMSIEGEDAAYQWDFVDIQANSFTWQGRKQDEAGEWVLFTEFKLRRRASSDDMARVRQSESVRLGQ